MAAVVICLAAFSIFAAYTVRTQVDRAQDLDSLHASYDSAISAIGLEETSELEFLLDPSLDHGARVSAANNALISAVNEIERRGGPDDAQLAKDISALQARYYVAAERVAGSMASGDTTEALRLNNEVADPIFQAMRDEITAATEVRAAEDDSAFADLHFTARWMLLLSPLVFAIGFVLLIALWRILDQYHRATRETYREIEQLSRLRGEFVSIVSHEFRTPLTGVQGFSEMMRDEELTIPEMREYASDINKDARRLSSLINDMLDLDLMESGRMKLRFAQVDLNRIVTDAAAQFSSSAADHPIALHLAEGVPMLEGESDRLTQVVTNLLSNAIKYSPSGGAIELRTSREGPMATLTVRDHGIGIPAEQLVKIFDRYSRIETTATPSVKGIGLGLAIVSQIVRLHHGTVWATSEVGEGSVFHVQLPLAESAALAPRPQLRPHARTA